MSKSQSHSRVIENDPEYTDSDETPSESSPSESSSEDSPRAKIPVVVRKDMRDAHTQMDDRKPEPTPAPKTTYFSKVFSKLPPQKKDPGVGEFEQCTQTPIKYETDRNCQTPYNLKDNKGTQS
jgi:hypothetical protein